MRKIALLVAAAILAGYWAWGVSRQAAVNDDIRLTDQDAYIGFARSVRESGFTDTGGRNRMPLYPMIQALFYDDDLTTQAFFERGKAVNAVLAALVLLMVFALMARRLSFAAAALTTAIAAFTVFAYKAPYFQADLLYYGFAFAAFVLSFETVMEPRRGRAAGAGAAAAAAHLVKASATPLVALAVACLALRAALELWRARRALPPARRYRPAARTVTALVVLAGVFLLVLAPYLVESKARYGSYFYNVNSTYYIWYDSWEEAKAGTAARGDREGSADMPAEDLPSAARYFATHDLGEIAERVRRGMQANYANLVHYRVAEYFLVFVIALTVIAAANGRRLLARLAAADMLPAALFVPGYFAGYGLLYAFYAPIASGPRFVLSLVLPGLYVAALVTSRPLLERLSFSALPASLGGRTAARVVSTLVLVALAALLAWELTVRFPEQIDTVPSSE